MTIHGKCISEHFIMYSSGLDIYVNVHFLLWNTLYYFPCNFVEIGYFIEMCIVWQRNACTKDPHLSEPQLTGFSDYPAVDLMYSS